MSSLYTPKPVKTAAGTLAVALLLGLLTLGLDLFRFHTKLLDTLGPLHQGIAYAVLLVIIVMVSNRQGWARFLLAAYLVAGLIVCGPVILELLGRVPVIGALAAAHFALILVGLAMLFGPRAGEWYRR